MHSHPRSYPRSPGLPVQRSRVVHGGSSGVVADPQHADRLPRRLLVLVVGADPLNGAAPRSSFRVGPARAWPHRPRPRRADGRPPPALCRVDEGATVAQGKEPSNAGNLEARQ